MPNNGTRYVAASKRGTFLILRRVLAALQPILLLSYIGSSGVAHLAAVLAMQQLLFSAAVTGWGWWIYNQESTSVRFWSISLNNVKSSLPGLFLGSSLALAGTT